MFAWLERLLLRRAVRKVGWYAPDDPTPREQCPCCDYITLPERFTYLICPICFWEDEGLDHDRADAPSGANHGLTLREARQAFRTTGAVAPHVLQHVLPEASRAAFEHRPRTLDGEDDTGLPE